MNTNDIVLLIIAICALVSIGLFIAFFVIDYMAKHANSDPSNETLSTAKKKEKK